MQSLDKTNRFIDKRFGEDDRTLSAEEKRLARFQRERERRLTRGDAYSLDDDNGKDGGGGGLSLSRFGSGGVQDEGDADELEGDELTHGGTSLSKIKHGKFCRFSFALLNWLSYRCVCVFLV